MKNLPVYKIDEFNSLFGVDHFYANYVNPHVKENDFTELPHKHDFYLIILFTAGSGVHEIDFKSYEIQPNTLFILRPGEMHYWKLSKDIDGFVFFHSKAFYNQQNLGANLENFEFFSSFYNIPMLEVPKQSIPEMSRLFQSVVYEYKSDIKLKWEKIYSLVSLIYIEISRFYKPQRNKSKRSYLGRVRRFEALIEERFNEVKKTKDYARLLNISEKHLTRITKECYNKTSSQLINERVLLEAQRLLMHTGMSVKEISYELGFNDSSYFIRFFKKHTGSTPREFYSSYLEEK